MSGLLNWWHFFEAPPSNRLLTYYMKFFRLALVLSAAAVCVLRAQDDEKAKAPPTEIPDFNNLDEYIYVPKSTLNYGYRFSTGIKATFSGHGQILSPEQVLDENAPNVSRTYHDGTVGPDGRSLTTDNGNGTNSSTSLNSVDGKTNTYTYDSQSQYTTDGFLNFNLYSAAISNTSVTQKAKGNSGLEVFVAHDMKKLTKHWEWKLFGGMSINDIQAASAGFVTAKVTTPNGYLRHLRPNAVDRRSDFYHDRQRRRRQR